MEKILQQLLEGQTQIIKRLDNIEKDISNTKNDVSNIKNDISNTKNDISNIKGQLDENTQIVKALIHRADELDAKYDCLLHTTATRDSITELDTKFDILNDRLFQQETRLLVLTKAK